MLGPSVTPFFQEFYVQEEWKSRSPNLKYIGKLWNELNRNRAFLELASQYRMR
jgi:hypothetical protein